MLRKPPESATKVSAKVLIPTTFEFLKRQTSRKVARCARRVGVRTRLIIPVCRKYEKDGTLQKSFSRKAAIGQKRHGSSKSSNSFAQIMEHFSKLEKTVKKSQKSARKKKRRQEDSDSSDSDLE